MCVVRVVIKAERLKILHRPYRKERTQRQERNLYTFGEVRCNGTTNGVVEVKTET